MGLKQPKSALSFIEKGRKRVGQAEAKEKKRKKGYSARGRAEAKRVFGPLWRRSSRECLRETHIELQRCSTKLRVKI